MFAYCRNNPVKRRDITGFGDKEDADGDGDFFEIEEYGGGGGSRYAYGGDGSYWSSCTTGGGAAGGNYSNVRTPNQQALADLAKEVNYNARHGQFISYSEAQILDEWAMEYAVPQHHQALIGSGSHRCTGWDHTHIYKYHVPFM